MRLFFDKLFSGKNFYFLIVTAVVAILPIYFFGLPTGIDMPHHYQCALTYYESFSAGDFFPSWSLNRNLGFGGMETRLYPPLSHYSLALVFLVVKNWHIASWLVITCFTFCGGGGVYLWAREYMPARQAVYAGCLYILFPYHLSQIYSSFLYAEYVGACIIPFVFLFVARICRNNKFWDVFGLAVSLAALILTHLPLTVIGAFCFIVYGLSLLEREKIRVQLGKLACGVITGLAASSFFWTKVLQEKAWLAKSLVYPDGWSDYRLHFLFTPIQTYEGAAVYVYNDATSFYDLMLLVMLTCVLACTIPFYVWARQTAKNLQSVWILFGFSLFMTLVFSRFVWDALPLLQDVQFPWRFLTIVCLAGAILTAEKLDILAEWFQNKYRPYALIIAGCLFAVIAFSAGRIVYNASYLPAETVPLMVRVKSQERGFAFWWTIRTKKEALLDTNKISAGARTTEIESWQPTERNFQISPGENENVRVATFYHPNWKATVNDLPVKIKSDENGAILIPVPPHNSTVKLYFQETSVQQIGQLISGLTWLGIIFFLVLQLFRAKFTSAETIY
jgi:hypothetical protein